MTPDITIFTATAVTFTVGMKRQTVDGSEMSFHTTNFLLEYHVEEPCVELPHP